MSRRKPKYTELTAKVDALVKLRRKMAELHNSAATHDGGWAISTGALREFIRELDAILGTPVGSEPQRAAASGDSHAS